MKRGMKGEVWSFSDRRTWTALHAVPLQVMFASTRAVVSVQLKISMIDGSPSSPLSSVFPMTDPKIRLCGAIVAQGRVVVDVFRLSRNIEFHLPLVNHGLDALLMLNSMPAEVRRSFRLSVGRRMDSGQEAVMYDDLTGKVDAPATSKSFIIIPLSETPERSEFSST